MALTKPSGARILKVLLIAAFLLAGAVATASLAFAQDGTTPPRRHAVALIGEPKFPADFKHFDWVNPEAPKVGTVRLSAIGSFDSLNRFSTKGAPAAGMGLIDATLMSASLDEPSTEYALVAEWVSYPADYSSVTFGLRPEARFHDGQPVTPEDVMFSLEAVKKAHPFYGLYFKNVVKSGKTGEREVTFTFDQPGNRELPHIMGQLPVLAKHFWERKDAQGNPRDLGESTLEVPVASGPYKIKSSETGRSITYERVKDWWGEKLPVSIGQSNFDEINFQYYRDRVPAFEAFKAGQLDYWDETSATAWATNYGFDAVTDGRVKKEAIAIEQVAPMQGFAFNTRRKQFQDPRVRRAFNLAFNFERANETLFYGQYKRVGSYFGGSELAATGLPQGRELEILTAVKDQVPSEVFTAEWKNPVNGDAGAFRKNMVEAKRLLTEAGWTINEATRLLTNKEGANLNAEFLLVQPDFERIVSPYVADLRSLGVNATVRTVDSSQYERRERSFDFDIVVDNIAQSLSPGNEQREFWGTAAAEMQGSRNLIGIQNPAVDKLIDEVVFAKNRDDLVAATRALDRVLLWNHYFVPQWYNPDDWVAAWNIFGRPDKMPSRSAGFLQIWWVDQAKKDALAAARS